MLYEVSYSSLSKSSKTMETADELSLNISPTLALIISIDKSSESLIKLAKDYIELCVKRSFNDMLLLNSLLIDWTNKLYLMESTPKLVKSSSIEI